MEPPSSAPTSKDMLSFIEVFSYNARPSSGETAMYEQQNRPSRVAVMDQPTPQGTGPMRPCNFLHDRSNGSTVLLLVDFNELER